MRGRRDPPDNGNLGSAGLIGTLHAAKPRTIAPIIGAGGGSSLNETPLDFAAARAARLYSPTAYPEDTEGVVFRAVQQASVEQTGEPLTAAHTEAIAIGVIEALSQHYASLSRRAPTAQPLADPDDSPPRPEHVPLIRIIKRHGCTLSDNALGRLLAFVAEGHAHDQA